MPYAVLFKPSARQALLKLPRSVQSRLIDAADALADDPRPHGVSKLLGDDNLWRIRIGAYRMVYEIHDGRLLLLVVRVAN